MPANINQMFYSLEGGVPWHGEGTPVDKAKTSREAIKLAGLDWETALGPVYGGPDKVEIPWRRAVYRTDTGEVLSIMTEEYRLWQNKDGFDFLDSLLKDGRMVYEAAGSLSHPVPGLRIWIVGRLGDDMRIADDVFRRYVLVTAAHGTYGGTIGGSIHILPTDVRAICENTIQLAVTTAGDEKLHFKISHRAGMETQLELARNTLRITTESQRRMEDWLTRQTKIKVSAKKFDAISGAIFGSLDEATPARKRMAITQFHKIYDAEVEVGGRTLYSVVNAITGYADHKMQYNGPADKRASMRFQSVLLDGGRSQSFKRNAISEAIGLAK